ncbi:retrovirus-related pol polyprotein from transposon TNT 1-94 [Tanacetum coccineum]
METIYSPVTVDLISIQFPFKKQIRQLQSVSWLKPHQLKHDYGIEDFLILTSTTSTCFQRRMSGTKFLNKTLHAFFKEEGIEHQTSTPRKPEQNDIVERRNRTLVEAARTMLSASKPPLDGENLDKMKEKRDPCILMGYSTQSKGYHVYNKITRLIVESIHLRFDEIKEMPETSVANDTSGLIPQRQKASDYDKSAPFSNYKMFLLQQIQ